MSETELRELDAWIDRELFAGGKFVGLKKCGFWYRDGACGYTSAACDAGRFTPEEAKKREYLRGEEPVTIHELPIPHYTTSPADAMRVLERCVDESPYGSVTIYKAGDEWLIECKDGEVFESAQENTLPLAICLFARKLFSKP